jgi:hypothetical protein
MSIRYWSDSAAEPLKLHHANWNQLLDEPVVLSRSAAHL